MPPSEPNGRKPHTPALKPSGRIRQRGVALTEDALEALNQAIVTLWERERRTGRMTQSARAEMLDVSIVTSKRILEGTPVDRSTLAHAFRSVGLEWSDSYIRGSGKRVGAREELESDSDTEDDPESGSDFEGSSADRAYAPSGRRRWWWGAVALLLLVLALVAATRIVNRQAKVPPAWVKEYDASVARALEHYHAAKYAEARAEVERSLALARQYESYRNVPLSMKISGDLYAVQGRLEEALADYVAAEQLRRRMGSPPWPELHESMGLAQVRLGRFAEAERNLRICLDQYRQEQDRNGVALAYRNMGTLESARGRYAEANGWFTRSLSEAHRQKKPDLIADVRGQQGMMLLRQDRALEARTLLRECLDYWIAKGHLRWIATCELRLAQAEMRLGMGPSARARLERSRQTFVQIGDRSRTMEVDELLGQLGVTLAAKAASEAIGAKLDGKAKRGAQTPN